MNAGAQQTRCGIYPLAARLANANLQIAVAVDAVVELAAFVKCFSILEGEAHASSSNHRHKGAVPMPVFEPFPVCVGHQLAKMVNVLDVNDGRLRIFYFGVGDLELFEVCFRGP